MSSLESLLVQHPFFKELEPDHLHLVSGCASNVRFKSSEYIFREGGDANQFYLIRHGKVALQMFVPERGPITIETLEAGDVLGWSWLFPPYHWYFDAQAIELVRATAFDGQCLRTKCEADHDLGYELMRRFARVMSQRMQATRLQLLDVYGVHQ